MCWGVYVCVCVCVFYLFVKRFVRTHTAIMIPLYIYYQWNDWWHDISQKQSTCTQWTHWHFLSAPCFSIHIHTQSLRIAAIITLCILCSWDVIWGSWHRRLEGNKGHLPCFFLYNAIMDNESNFHQFDDWYNSMFGHAKNINNWLISMNFCF